MVVIARPKHTVLVAEKHPSRAERALLRAFKRSPKVRSMASTDDDDEAGGTARVPYVSYTTFKSSVLKLRVNGKLPSRIDRSVLTTMPGGTQGHFMASIKALRLVDDDGRPTPDLDKLSVEATYEATLKKLILSCYPAEAVEQLAHGTPNTLVESMPTKSRGTSTKAAIFLVQAALDAKVETSPHVESGGKPKGFGRKAKPKNKKAPPPPVPSATSAAQPTSARPDSGESTQVIRLGRGREARLIWPNEIDREEVMKLFAALQKFKEFLLELVPEEEDDDFEEEDS